MRVKTINFMKFDAAGTLTLSGKLGLAKTIDIESSEKLREYVMKVDGGIHAPQPGGKGVYYTTPGKYDYQKLAVLIDRSAK